MPHDDHDRLKGNVKADSGRAERLAAELRRNLRRRKGAARDKAPVGAKADGTGTSAGAHPPEATIPPIPAQPNAGPGIGESEVTTCPLAGAQPPLERETPTLEPQDHRNAQPPFLNGRCDPHPYCAEARDLRLAGTMIRDSHPKCSRRDWPRRLEDSQRRKPNGARVPIAEFVTICGALSTNCAIERTRTTH